MTPRLYTTNGTDGGVGVFNLDPSSGVPSFQYRIGANDSISMGNAQDVVVSPDGRFVYTAYARVVPVYRRDAGQDGVITQRVEVIEFPDDLPGSVTSLQLSPNGSHMFVATDEGGLGHLQRNAATGRLTGNPWRRHLATSRSLILR